MILIVYGVKMNTNLITKYIFYTITILFSFFILIFMFLQNTYYINNYLSKIHFFNKIGPKKLIFQDNEMNIVLKEDFNKLTFDFTEPINIFTGSFDCKYYENGQTIDISKEIKIKIIDNKKRINVLNNNSRKGGETHITIYLQNIDARGVPRRYIINNVQLNNNKKNLYDFYLKYLIPEKTNLKYYRPFAIINVSNTLATLIGGPLLSLVTSLLLFLFGYQFYNFILIIPKSFFSVSESKDFNDLFPLNIINKLSTFSIYLGFLGTIISIWVALEKANVNLTDFFQILNIIKYAIFTSVLGILTNTLFFTRNLLYNGK